MLGGNSAYLGDKYVQPLITQAVFFKWLWATTLRDHRNFILARD